MSKSIYDRAKNNGIVLVGTSDIMNEKQLAMFEACALQGNARHMRMILKKWDPIMAVHLDIETPHPDDRKWKKRRDMLTYHRGKTRYFYKIKTLNEVNQ